ncbi:MAG: SRPBCC family protein [Gemmatimonadales bacterium]
MASRSRVMRWIWILIGVVIGLPAAASLVGMFLPRDHVARMTISLKSPPERVWALVSDLGGTARWRSEIVKVDVVEGSGKTVRFAETTKQGQVTFEVESQVAPRRQVTRIVDEGEPFGGTWTWELAPEGGGTRLTLVEAGFIKSPLFRVMAKLFFEPSETIDAYLRALAKALGETATPQEG